MSACTFAAYAALADTPLTAASAFTALALFNLLKQPLRQMPRALTSAVDLHVSFRRLDRFFALGEVERLHLDELPPTTIAAAAAAAAATTAATAAAAAATTAATAAAAAAAVAPEPGPLLLQRPMPRRARCSQTLTAEPGPAPLQYEGHYTSLAAAPAGVSAIEVSGAAFRWPQP